MTTKIDKMISNRQEPTNKRHKMTTNSCTMTKHRYQDKTSTQNEHKKMKNYPVKKETLN